MNTTVENDLGAWSRNSESNSAGQSSVIRIHKLTSWGLALLLAVQISLYSVLRLLSHQFEYHTLYTTRPLIPCLIILAILFAAYLCSIPLAIRVGGSRRWRWAFLLSALAMRAVLFPSEPIQEVDIYRYLWDGAVSNEGVSPYAFAPAEVRRARANRSATLNNIQLGKLADLPNQAPGLGEVIQRVHFPQVPTVYPPVSQTFFQLAAWTHSNATPLRERVLTIKGVILLFDVGVLLLLGRLLQLTGKRAGWMVAYGWCPLVIKEFANSGHLDSIAVFFTLAALTAAVQASRVVGVGNAPRFQSLPYALVSGLCLGLAVGSKLYPVVLFPLITTYLWRTSNVRAALVWIAVATLTTTVTLAPMVGARQDVAFGPPSTEKHATESDEGKDYSQVETAHPVVERDGLTTFLTHWEINDLLFMTIEENLRPISEGSPQLWFAVVPNHWRTVLHQSIAKLVGDDPGTIPFLATRLLTSVSFACLALLWCHKTARMPQHFLESAFLTLAWFWLLSPTQNPWYWTWALPLVPFTRNRLWLLVSGCALIYYARFWFEYHLPGFQFGSRTYQGTEIFDYWITWLEFAPLLIALFATWVVRKSDLSRLAMRRHSLRASTSSTS